MPLTPPEKSYGLDDPEVRLTFEVLATEIRVLVSQRLETDPSLKAVDLQGLVDRVVKNSSIFGSGKITKAWRLNNFFYKRENLASIPSSDLYRDFRDYYLNAEKESVENITAVSQGSVQQHARHQNSILNGSNPSEIDNLAKDIENIFTEIVPNGIEIIQSLFNLKNQHPSSLRQHIASDILNMIWPKDPSISLNSYNGSVSFFKFLANTPFVSLPDIYLFASELDLNITALLHSHPHFLQLLKNSPVAGRRIFGQNNPENEIGESFVKICDDRILIRECLDLPSSKNEKINHLYNYLCAYFSLQKGDIPPHFLIETSSMSSDDFRRAILNDKELVNRGILNIIAEAVGHYGVPEEFCNRVSEKVLDSVIDRLTEKPYERLKKVVLREAYGEIQEVAKGYSKKVKKFREIALTSSIVKGFSEIIGEASPYAYTDEQILDEYKLEERQNSERRGIYLPTWFDSAQFGMISQKRRSEMVDKRETTEFTVLKDECSEALIHYHGVEGYRQFKSTNIHFFSEGGSQAFDKFSTYINENDEFLVTDEVYGGVKSSIENRGVSQDNIHSLPHYSGDEKIYEKAMRDIIGKKKNLKYIVVSELSRRGTAFPLHVFKQVRDYFRKKRRTIYLILDCCQSFGRFKSDYAQSMADVIFASSHKGTDFENGAFLMLSNRFVHNEGELTHHNGMEDAHAMASTLLAVDPKNKSAYGKGALTIPERQKALQILSRKFIRLMKSAEDKGAIKGFQFLYPASASESSGPSDAYGIFECEIKGITREQVNFLAQKYGVYIADQYQDPASPNSFRIGFHPRMNDNSIKILVYSLIRAYEFFIKQKMVDKK